MRQHLIADQMAGHLQDVRTALDVGCGQGTQALALAARGIAVLGVDPSAALLAQLTETAARQNLSVETLVGRIELLPGLLGGRTFDLVAAHGLLMYLDNAPAAVAALAAHVRPGGALSITFRNKDALAFRPGIRGQWALALAAFDETGYVNELGASATAHSLSQLSSWCAAAGLTVEAWYGVRVFTDGWSAESRTESMDVQACLAAETEAGRRDPYRALGAQLHVIARR